MGNHLHWKKENYRVSTDKSLLDITAIHQFLTFSHWAKGIDLETVRCSIENSLTFGLFYEKVQIGFARFVTDFSTFGYLCDVYVLEEYQKQQLGSWLMTCCQSHPVIQRLRRVMLVTSSAHSLYEKFGYSPVNRENFVWQIFRPDVYEKN
ncbi:GNAT family N-acetyltransferase [Xenorhabdus cabanillasii]|uniref:Acetyltransferase (GNAT) family protein n=2 Tax=Xenorhabdus cabanillasii TaxID=351673 RepID=A0A3D9UD69_9GAMM|nr:GNAT family N-acetyltransferase [Xenorhabdus cabanillasii]PHM76004.1 histone acetyltransferase [Xenorhabdus cabanillasii JM26]REF27438.1 acetyltransferase (GNAT) family protein [Xenorhabdus cabanillasii]CDL87303.1 GCN5-related N-acetyltransferase [Xenorhabdus cabanillasii JM26]